MQTLLVLLFGLVAIAAGTRIAIDDTLDPLSVDFTEHELQKELKLFQQQIDAMQNIAANNFRQSSSDDHRFKQKVKKANDTGATTTNQTTTTSSGNGTVASNSPVSINGSTTNTTTNSSDSLDYLTKPDAMSKWPADGIGHVTRAVVTTTIPDTVQSNAPRIVSSASYMWDISPDPLGEVSYEDIRPAKRTIKNLYRYIRKSMQKPPPDVDPSAQTSWVNGTAPPLFASTLTHFEGIGAYVSGGGPLDSVPAEANGAVGTSHYFECVHRYLAIYRKNGQRVAGPMPGNAVWNDFGGACERCNEGVAWVTFDKRAKRWVLSQAATCNERRFYHCVAISENEDPMGRYYRYAFPHKSFPDSVKMSSFGNAYYVTHNVFTASAFQGGAVCAYDRTRMLAGKAASQVCVLNGPSVANLLAVDQDGLRPPPDDMPALLFSLGNDSINTWTFQPDFTSPDNSAFKFLGSVPVAPFTPACHGLDCIPQKGTGQRLDSLSDRLMPRAPFRYFPARQNFSAHGAIVLTHAIVPAGKRWGSGIRWYELRVKGNELPKVHQQGSYQPDYQYRWLSSAAMDRRGNIGIGFSVSSGAHHPGIGITGWHKGDPRGTLQKELVPLRSEVSQPAGLNRWGDHSSMTVDPEDGCTMYYVNQYAKTYPEEPNRRFGWGTRIFTFKFPSCLVNEASGGGATPLTSPLAPSNTPFGKGLATANGTLGNNGTSAGSGSPITPVLPSINGSVIVPVVNVTGTLNQTGSLNATGNSSNVTNSPTGSLNATGNISNVTNSPTISGSGTVNGTNNTVTGGTSNSTVGVTNATNSQVGTGSSTTNGSGSSNSSTTTTSNNATANGTILDTNATLNGTNGAGSAGGGNGTNAKDVEAKLKLNGKGGVRNVKQSSGTVGPSPKDLKAKAGEPVVKAASKLATEPNGKEKTMDPKSDMSAQSKQRFRVRRIAN